MLFSVIVPVYNAEKFLVQCISSIINQLYPDWELILVDDGSTDSSSKMCDNYAHEDSRIHVVHLHNQGASIARKVGCDRSKGDYVCFVDSDDWITPDCLSKAEDAIKCCGADVIAFASCNSFPDGTVSDRLFQFHGYYDKKRIETEIFPFLIQNEKAEYYTSSIWGSCYRRELLAPLMIANTKAVFGEDTACVIPTIYRSKSIYFLNERLYYYRLNEQSLTGGRRVYSWDNPAIIARHIESLIDDQTYDFRQQLYRKLVHDVFNVCVSRFFLKEGYHCTAREIRKNLRFPMYEEAIHNAHFKGNAKAMIMSFAMKYDIIPLIYLAYCIKRIHTK